MRMRLVCKYRLVKHGRKFHISSGPILCDAFRMRAEDKFHSERMGDIDEQQPLAKKDSFNPLEMRMLCAKLGRSVCQECVERLYADCAQLPQGRDDDSLSKYVFLENSETGEIHLVELSDDMEEDLMDDLTEEP